jgi:hypothetical protein
MGKSNRLPLPLQAVDNPTNKKAIRRLTDGLTSFCNKI